MKHPNLLRTWYISKFKLPHRTLTYLPQYSPNYYRATWISTGFDAGFATAMTIRPKWLKDICSVLFSVYYIVYATEADEKVHLLVHFFFLLWLNDTPSFVVTVPCQRSKCSARRGRRPPTHMYVDYTMMILYCSFFCMPAARLQ